MELGGEAPTRVRGTYKKDNFGIYHNKEMHVVILGVPKAKTSLASWTK